MVELLKQPQYQPMDVVDQVMSIFAGSEGYLDEVPVKEVQRWEKEFLAFIRDQKPKLREVLKRDKKLTDTVLADLKAAITEFQAHYRPSTVPTAKLAGAKS